MEKKELFELHYKYAMTKPKNTETIGYWNCATCRETKKSGIMNTKTQEFISDEQEIKKKLSTNTLEEK